MGEHYLDTVGVTGSIPVSPTRRRHRTDPSIDTAGLFALSRTEAVTPAVSVAANRLEVEALIPAGRTGGYIVPVSAAASASAAGGFDTRWQQRVRPVVEGPNGFEAMARVVADKQLEQRVGLARNSLAGVLT